MMLLALALTLITPHPVLTPGVVRSLSIYTVCNTVWHLDRRHVTEKMKKTVAADYKIDWKDRSQYEFDHLIPRSLGGADSIQNLWPQPRFGTWNAQRKDRLEVRLGQLVCKGSLPLHTAQEAMKHWIGAYRAFIGDK